MCRLCLTPNSGTTPLFENSTMKPNVLILQKVVECISIQLSIEDDYPSSICHSCLQKLNEWSAFKIQCIVNNSFYREKQAELRKKIAKAIPEPSEVVCLDDDDDEEDEQPGKSQPPVRKIKPPEKCSAVPPVKKARIVEQVIIEDDDDEECYSADASYTAQPTNGAMVGRIVDPAPLYHQTDNVGMDNEQEQDYDASLDDYELVEGQEIDNTAILTSILLDDDDSSDSGLLAGEMGFYEGSYPFECTFCKRRYATVNKLQAHMKKHSQRMKCFICGKMIAVHLLRHLRSQHAGQAFPEPVRCWHIKCAYLENAFTDVDQLLEHMASKKFRK